MPRPRRLTHAERGELEAMETTILDAEARRDSLGELLTSPALYVDTPDRVGAVRAEFEEAGRHVEGLYARWAELESIVSGRTGG
jgi:hypothetical protein